MAGYLAPSGQRDHQTVAQRNLTCAIRIAERRRDLGLTQAEVVDRVSRYGSRLSKQALSAIENGRRLAVGRLPDLAAALDCTVTYLIGLTGDPRSWQPDGPGAPAAYPGASSPEARHPARTTRPDPARRSWILGPDVPDIPGELRARGYQAGSAAPSA